MAVKRVWRARDLEFPLGERTLLMGILNVTPDSFSDGGRFNDTAAAVEQAQAMAADGADILDLGGESTRPGGAPVDADEEWSRVEPVLQAMKRLQLPPVSIDTYRAQTARKALELGAAVVNDVWGFQKDPEIARVVSDHGAGAVLMHNRDRADGNIAIMQDVVEFLSRSVDIALRAGIAEERIVLDPGVGFGKTVEQSIEVIARLDIVTALGFPVLVGASRKRFIGHILGIDDPMQRVSGTVGAHLAAVAGGADIVRVHDVGPHREALGVFDAIRRNRT